MKRNKNGRLLVGFLLKATPKKSALICLYIYIYVNNNNHNNNHNDNNNNNFCSTPQSSGYLVVGVFKKECPLGFSKRTALRYTRPVAGLGQCGDEFGTDACPRRFRKFKETPAPKRRPSVLFTPPHETTSKTKHSPPKKEEYCFQNNGCGLLAGEEKGTTETFHEKQEKDWGHYFDGFCGFSKSVNGGCFPLTS